MSRVYHVNVHGVDQKQWQCVKPFLPDPDPIRGRLLALVVAGTSLYDPFVNVYYFKQRYTPAVCSLGSCVRIVCICT